MSDTANQILQWLNANPEWSGFITFLISAAESIAVIGTIVPGAVMMTAVGTLAGSGFIPIWPTIVWAILGAIVGDGVSYWLGYYYKDRVHQLWPFSKYPSMLATGERFFQKYGSMSVFVGRFVGPVRALVPVVAGMFNVTPLRFTIANIISAIGWAPVYMFPGILLGAASLELPPDVATHAVVVLLLIGLLIILCLWIIQKLISLIANQINESLNKIWQNLNKSRYFFVVTSILKHHNPRKTHGQLVLAFYLVIALFAFLSLGACVKYSHSQHIMVNEIFFHFFRSLRTPLTDQVMRAITVLGEKFVVYSIVAIIFTWLILRKHWYTAWHVFALMILTGMGIEFTKHFVHSLRPWGIAHSPDGFSFPSGHTTLSAILFFGLALLLSNSLRLKRTWPLFTFCSIIVGLVAISRIYLGAHWLTDVVGGGLLSIALLMLVSLSYNRQVETRPINGRHLIVVALLALTLSYATFYARHIGAMQHNYQLIERPVHTIPLDSWWNRTSNYTPLYRLNRFGFAQEILNLQWLGNLAQINQLLRKNDWQSPPDVNWISVVQRITDVKSAEHLPLVSPLHLDKKPVLVLVKQFPGDKKLLVLRLWQSNVIINNNSQPLWVGSVELAPRTFSWLFKKTVGRKIPLTSDVIFTHAQHDFTIKKITLKNKENRNRPMILIKPRITP